MNDDWLVDQCLQGKTAYWSVLVRRYRNRLFKKVSCLVKNPEDASEVVEQALLHAATALPTFRDYQASVKSNSPFREAKTEPSFFLWLCRFAAEPTLAKARKV